MFQQLLFHFLALASISIAQTVVYTTGANGSLSAYLIIANATANPSNATAVANSTSSIQSTTLQTSISSSSQVITLPTASYTGQALLTGICNIPQYTALVLEDGGSIHVPLIGCSDDRPECCPSLKWAATTAGSTSTISSTVVTGGTRTGSSATPTGVISLLSKHPLSICPHDMVDIDPVCCPSGFTKWGQAILGNTPCASLLSTSFAVPSSVLGSITSSVASSVGATLTGSDAAVVASPTVTVIVNQVFALGIPCDDDDNYEHGLSAGAKGGIGAGAAIGGIMIGLGIWAFIIFRRKRRSQHEDSPEPVTSTQQIPRKPLNANTMGYDNRPSQVSTIPPKSDENEYTRNSEYGQGFVDGIKAAMSPPMNSPGSPPPTYGYSPRPVNQVPAEAPTRTSLYAEPAELSVDQISHQQRNTRG